MLYLKLEDSRLLLHVGLIKTYILLSFLYWVKAPGGMILMRFCSKRLKTNKVIYMLTTQLQDRNNIKHDNKFLHKYETILQSFYANQIFLLKATTWRKYWEKNWENNLTDHTKSAKKNKGTGYRNCTFKAHRII